MKTKFFLAALLLAATCFQTQAHDFMVSQDGQVLYFNITDQDKHTAEVTYKGNGKAESQSALKGEVTIPSKVRHNDTIYTVTGIGDRAFIGAGQLTGVIIPSGVKAIGDFAFERCTSLSKIVFPANQVKFGNEVFINCSSISDISFGSDWKEVDLKLFSSSTQLKSLFIPVFMERIQNMKSLKSLCGITVDANNTRFSSVDGLLYSKDGKTLYGCPLSRKGAVGIAEGVETVNPGSLMDCSELTSVTLPSSLKRLSFREFSQNAQLREITFRSAIPVMTATSAGKEYFLLQVASPKVIVNVPKASLAAYKSVLCLTEGEYTLVGAKTETSYQVKSSELLPAKNLKGVKNLDK